MNTILKRTGGVLIIIIAALVLLASAGGVIGLWTVNSQVHDVANAVFAPVESGLDTANKALDKVDTRLDNARTRISNAQEVVGQLGQNSISNGAVLGAISDTIAVRFGQEIDAARDSVDNAIELINGVNSAIVAVNRLPFVELPTLTDRLQSVQTRISSLRDRVQELRSDIEATIQGRLQMTGARINGLLENMDSGLQDVQGSVNEYTTTVQELQARIATQKSNVASAIDTIWTILTVLLLWIAFSQVVTLLYGWSLLRSKPVDITVVPAAPPAGGDLTAKPA